MNSLKNLLIIAVLGAVGYGMYVSLARTNADNNQPPGVAEGWPTVPKVELPSANTTLPPGGSLAASGNPPAPAGASRRNGFAAGAPVRRRSRRQSTGRSSSHGARSAIAVFVTSGSSFGDGIVEPGSNLGHTDAARGRVGRAGGHFDRAGGKPRAAVQPGAQSAGRCPGQSRAGSHEPCRGPLAE